MADAKTGPATGTAPPRATHTVEAIPADVTASQFLGNPALDNVVSCLVAMNAEMWAMRRRMHVMEAVLTKHGISSNAIEQYVPSAAEKSAWERDRDRFVAFTLGNLGNPSSISFGTGFSRKG